ncbi:hypothetical protein CRENBAI_026895 [Crenichthys baileyi]|uniref:Uncharacterized protein n=1 Tax=Crenichthys baileyi TaxID=28760 RepID=A0AAV9RBF8_9TELE
MMSTAQHFAAPFTHITASDPSAADTCKSIFSGVSMMSIQQHTDSEGSSESIYEPVNSHTLKEFLPKSQCRSGSLRCKAEWGGSDPSINSNGETGTDSDETIQTTGKLKKLQNLVHVKNGPKNVNDRNTCSTKKHACMEEGVRHHSTGLTCISLSRRTEKSSSEAVSPSQPHQLQQNTRNSHEDPTERGFWSPKMGHYRWKPFECPEAWPFKHTGHQVPHQLCTHSGNSSSPPWNSDWDRFESLIQELDQKQSDLSLSQMIRTLTDLQCSQNTEKQETVEPKLQRSEMETSSENYSKHINISQEKTQTALTVGYA